MSGLEETRLIEKLRAIEVLHARRGPPGAGRHPELH